MPATEQCDMTAKKLAVIDIVKGILILVVIAGHNEGMMQHAPWVRRVFYYFNTQCFFLLSSMLDTKPLSGQLLRDRAIRYLVPFGWFMLLAWVAFISLRGGNQPLPAAIAQLGRAILFGSEPAIYQAVGMRYLWFLPALFSLVVIKAAAIRWPGAGKALWLAACGLIVGVAFVPAGVIESIPFNAATGLFFFGLGEVCRRVAQAASRLPGSAAGLAAGGMTAALSALIALAPLGWVAGANIRSYDIMHWATWITAVVFPCSMLIALMQTSRFFPAHKLLALCGRYSLPLYLVHMLLYRVLTLSWFGRDFDDLAIVGRDFSAGLAIFGLTVAGSLALAIAIWRMDRVRRLIFPRDWSEFSGVFGSASA